MNAKILQRLIWKDSRSIRALVLATLVSILGFYVLLVLLTSLASVGTERISIAYAIWFLLPMLIAVGAPAVLVGGEEESGSLAWLRTLPAGWKSIVASKMLVTAGALALVWAFSTAMFQLYIASLSEFWIGRINLYEGLPEPLALHLVGLVAVSVILMLCSMITAFQFRSPITALIAIVPLFIGVMWFVFGTLDWLLPGLHFRRPESLGGPWFLAIGMFVSAAILALFVLSLLVAWRRMTKPEKTAPMDEAEDSDSGAFRPPRQAPATWYAASMVGTRPSPIGALLWLQLRPIRGYLVMLVAAGIFGSFLVMTNTSGVSALGILLCGGSLFLISTLTFYGDSVRKRCIFLSDRGIPAGQVWLTRVGPTLAATCLILIAITVMLLLDRYLLGAGLRTRMWTHRGLSVASIVLASYALSQLASQWSLRPTLGFFAGPVFVHMAAFALAGLFFFYTAAIPVLLLSAVILLYASYRLTPRWMSGERGKRYVVGAIAAVAVAVILPYLVVLTTRYVTTPDEMTRWSRQLATIELPQPAEDSVKMAIMRNASTRRLESLATASKVSWEGRGDRLKAELESTETVGDDISVKELLQILTNVSDFRVATHESWFEKNRELYSRPLIWPDTEESSFSRADQFDAVRILLKWSGETRRQAVVGQADLRSVLEVAEIADLLATRTIAGYLEQRPPPKEIEGLLQALPSRELVRDSRRNSVIRSWRSSGRLNRFAGKYLHPPNQWWLGVERLRSRRFLDQLTRLLLDRWVDGEGFSSPESLAELQKFERESYLGYERGLSVYYSSPGLSEQVADSLETDRLLKQLWRERDRRLAQDPPSDDGDAGLFGNVEESEQ